ncbi:hypothetical protein HK101_011932 [Irineochytrium annulatum]|nr:hypothetical protein HK101_011932 [Irineochytrium annulatum]
MPVTDSTNVSLSHEGRTFSVPTGLFINNEFVPSVSGKKFKTVDSATGEVICELYEGDKEDVDKAVNAAKKAFATWRKTPPQERARLLNKLADLVERDIDLLANLESWDNGKHMNEARHVDLPFVVMNYRYYAGWADKNVGKVMEINADHHVYTRHEPFGVVGQIIPWNFPLLMMAWKLGPALTTGNCVVMKTSEKTPLSALKVCELIVEAGFPPGVVNIISGFGQTAGEAIARHMGISKVAFTGSTGVGRKIMAAAAASNLKKVSLELGGKSPNIIFEDADLDAAAEASKIGFTLNHGQVCCAGTRIYVQETVYEKFVDKLAAAAGKIKLGGQFEKDANHGALVDEVQFKRVMGYIDEGKKAGAKAVIGGKRFGDKGYFVEPTIFTDVNDDMSIVKEEIFGPVVCVQTFKTIEEIIERANNTNYGLAAAVHTKNVSTAHRMAAELQSGTVWVNTYNMLMPSVPFGGFKESGMGREGGEYAIQEYTQVKAVYIALQQSDKSAMFNLAMLARFALCVALCVASASAAKVTNSNLARHIDLTAPGIVRERVQIIFQAGSQDISEYVVALPGSLVKNKLSYLNVAERRDRKSNAPPVTLEVTKAALDPTSGLQYYNAKLSSPLKAGDKSSVDITAVYTHIVKPYPKVVGQVDPQFLEFASNIYASTPYLTEKQKTTVRLPTSNLKSELNGPNPVARSGSLVSFGPYTGVNGGSYEKLYLHFEEPKAILVAKTFRKDTEISHLGSNLAIMESYDLHHQGAELRDSAFSRIDYQFSVHRHPMTNVVKDIKMTLPGDVSNVYYRDDIGNVSTSNLRHGRKASQLLMRPRYPLYGGWKYSWFIHFDSPLATFLKQDTTRSGRFVFSIPFIGSISNITIDTATLSVLLPEGARNVKVALPFVSDKTEMGVHYTNLDTTGRVNVVIQKYNVADEYAVPVQISYDYPSVLLIQKPVVVALVTFGLLLFGMMYARMDFAIVKAVDTVVAGKQKTLGKMSGNLSGMTWIARDLDKPVAKDYLPALATNLLPPISHLHISMKPFQREFIEFAITKGALTFGSFVLKSGRVSPYFFNSGLFNSGRALLELGKFYAAALVDSGLEYDIIFGPAYKGIPLVSSTAISLALHHSNDVPYCFNRKEKKDHGEGGNIVGAPLRGRVALIDDVITAGTAIRESYGVILNEGATLVGVLISLNRQERGLGETTKSAIQQVEDDFKVPVVSIVTLKEVVEYLREKGKTAEVTAIVEYWKDAFIDCLCAYPYHCRIVVVKISQMAFRRLFSRRLSQLAETTDRELDAFYALLSSSPKPSSLSGALKLPSNYVRKLGFDGTRMSSAFEPEAEGDLASVSKIIGLNSAMKRPVEAQKAFDLIAENGLQADVKAYNNLMSAHASVGDVRSVSHVFKKMCESGLKPDAKSYGALVKTCASRGQVRAAFRIYEAMKRNGVTPDAKVFTSLINGCVRTGDLDRAWKTFDYVRAELLDPDTVLYTLMIYACARSKDCERALDLFKEMAEKGVPASPLTFTSLIQACGSRPDYYLEALSLFDQMVAEGFVPSRKTYDALVQAASVNKDLRTAVRLWNELLDRSLLDPGLEPGMNTFRAILATLAASTKAQDWHAPVDSIVDVGSPTTTSRHDRHSLYLASDSLDVSNISTSADLLANEFRRRFADATATETYKFVNDTYLSVYTRMNTELSAAKALQIYAEEYGLDGNLRTGKTYFHMLQMVTKDAALMKQHGKSIWESFIQWDLRREKELNETNSEGHLTATELELRRRSDYRGKDDIHRLFTSMVLGHARADDITSSIRLLEEAKTFRGPYYLEPIQYKHVMPLVRKARDDAENGDQRLAKLLNAVCEPVASNPAEEVRRQMRGKWQSKSWWGWEAMGMDESARLRLSRLQLKEKRRRDDYFSSKRK